MFSGPNKWLVNFANILFEGIDEFPSVGDSFLVVGIVRDDTLKSLKHPALKVRNLRRANLKQRADKQSLSDQR
jgi:hypothetical protein